jgi:hypothetical protein
LVANYVNNHFQFIFVIIRNSAGATDIMQSQFQNQIKNLSPEQLQKLSQMMAQGVPGAEGAEGDAGDDDVPALVDSLDEAPASV